MKVFLVLVYVFALQNIGSSTANFTWARNSPIAWEKYLPLIIAYESSNYMWAQSYKGREHGRGLYQVSEILLKEYQRLNADMEWIKPDGLYNTNIARVIALWQLRRLESVYYKNDPECFAKCLSAYHGGPEMVRKYGIDTNYVLGVLAGFKNL